MLFFWRELVLFFGASSCFRGPHRSRALGGAFINAGLQKIESQTLKPLDGAEERAWRCRRITADALGRRGVRAKGEEGGGKREEGEREGSSGWDGDRAGHDTQLNPLDDIVHRRDICTQHISAHQGRDRERVPASGQGHYALAALVGLLGVQDWIGRGADQARVSD